MLQSLSNTADAVINYRELFLDSPLAIFTCDGYGYINSYNAAAEDLWGFAPALHQDQWNGAWKLYNTGGAILSFEDSPIGIVLKSKQALAGTEVVIERPDGSFKNVLMYPQPLVDTQGNITGGYSTLIDITDTKTAKEKQAMLSAIVESSDDAIVSKNLNGFITSWNKGAQKIFGYTEEEVIGKHISILIPQHLLQEEEVIIGSIRAGKKIDHFQTVRVTKFGKQVDISLTISPIKNENGEITGASKIARDITEQLQKQRALKNYSQRLEILNSVGIKISEKLDEASIIQLVTDATTEITAADFGVFYYYNLDDETIDNSEFYLAGKYRELFNIPVLQNNKQLLEEMLLEKKVLRLAHGSNWDGFLYNHVGGGENISTGRNLLSYLAVPVMNNAGTIFGGLFFGHSLPGAFTTEHEEMVKSIASQASVAIDKSRLFKQVHALSEKKDEFIALASHELKTPLTTVNGYLQMLESQISDVTSKLFLERSINQVKKLNSLVADLFDVSKIEAGKLQLTYEQFDVIHLLQEILETYQHSCTTHQVILQCDVQECPVEADRQRIEQVINNLLTNAIKYSPNTESVLVHLTQSNEMVSVMVKDDGMGLTAEQQRNIFTRFYRAEGTANISGLGLGLYLSNEIIKRHNGKIFVKSELGMGAAFYFLIPAKRPAESANGNQS